MFGSDSSSVIRKAMVGLLVPVLQRRSTDQPGFVGDFLRDGNVRRCYFGGCSCRSGRFASRQKSDFCPKWSTVASKLVDGEFDTVD